MRWHLHRWGKWVLYNEPYYLQYRVCSVCGIRKTRIV